MTITVARIAAIRRGTKKGKGDDMWMSDAEWNEILTLAQEAVRNRSRYVPQQAAWVACSERLPTHEYSVLLFVTDCATQVAPFREIGIYNTKTGRFQINGGDDDIEVEVSHWADLPEPPGAQQCEPHESL
jgi:hypothetical protein